MPIEIKMPRLSDTMDTGKITEWRKLVGEIVEEGDILCVIETDKADVEFQSFYAGTLAEIRLEEGASAPLGTVIAILAEAGSARPPAAGRPFDPAGRRAPSLPPPPRPALPCRRPPPARRKGGGSSCRPSRGRSRRSTGSRSRPSAGADLKGGSSGPTSRRRSATAPLRSRPSRRPGRPRDPRRKRTPRLPGTRSAISWTSRPCGARSPRAWPPPGAPHFTAHADDAKAEAFRAEGDAAWACLNDLVVAAAARLRAAGGERELQEGKARRIRDVNVGVVVALEDGLVTPVIRDADRKRLSDIAREAADLVARGRTRRLRPEEYSGGSFTVSNLGMLGVEEFAAILNPPEAAILAVGAVQDTPTVRDGRLQVARVMKVTLSCDHRIIDGILAARFQKLREMLENPALLTL
jgi:pyruvate dehydrogenase E2 component (dihydrolipoamide acetyltransferase)